MLRFSVLSFFGGPLPLSPFKTRPLRNARIDCVFCCLCSTDFLFVAVFSVFSFSFFSHFRGTLRSLPPSICCVFAKILSFNLFCVGLNSMVLGKFPWHCKEPRPLTWKGSDFCPFILLFLLEKYL